MVLNLSQLIDMAIAQSPEIRGIQSEIAAAKSDLDQVRAAYFPQLEGTILTGPVQDAKEPEVRNGRITDPSPALSTSSIGIFGRLDLTATQPLCAASPPHSHAHLVDPLIIVEILGPPARTEDFSLGEIYHPGSDIGFGDRKRKPANH